MIGTTDNALCTYVFSADLLFQILLVSSISHINHRSGKSLGGMTCRHVEATGKHALRIPHCKAGAHNKLQSFALRPRHNLCIGKTVRSALTVQYGRHPPRATRCASNIARTILRDSMSAYTASTEAAPESEIMLCCTASHQTIHWS